jgi:hypothetical protein
MPDRCLKDGVHRSCLVQSSDQNQRVEKKIANFRLFQELSVSKRKSPVKKIQRYEGAYLWPPLFCLFCGKKVAISADKISPCKHTLYIAHDEGYEFVSRSVILALKKRGIKEDDETFYDEIEENLALDFPNALIVESYVPPPSGFGSYVCFTP